MAESPDSVEGVAPPERVTALILDLRDFTHQLNDAVNHPGGMRAFCQRLSRLYTLCEEVCRIGTPPDMRRLRPFHINSTGDGVLIVFLGEDHARRGFLCALLLRVLARSVFVGRLGRGADPASHAFGLGLESGLACRVPMKGGITFIGPCINTAQRAETLTKTYAGAECILGEQLVAHLYQQVLGVDRGGLLQQALPGEADTQSLRDAVGRLGRHDERLCLNYLHFHRLRGVEIPLALYGISARTAQPGSRAFDTMLQQLSAGPAHHQELQDLLARYAPAIEL